MNPLELSFTPVDNERLANLSGALDENLKQIESAFDVSIARRGEHFSMSGAPEPSRQAAEALQRFYQQAGRNLGLEEIQLGPGQIEGFLASRFVFSDPFRIHCRTHFFKLTLLFFPFFVRLTGRKCKLIVEFQVVTVYTDKRWTKRAVCYHLANWTIAVKYMILTVHSSNSR